MQMLGYLEFETRKNSNFKKIAGIKETFKKFP